MSARNYASSLFLCAITVILAVNGRLVETAHVHSDTPLPDHTLDPVPLSRTISPYEVISYGLTLFFVFYLWEWQLDLLADVFMLERLRANVHGDDDHDHVDPDRFDPDRVDPDHVDPDADADPGAEHPGEENASSLALLRTVDQIFGQPEGSFALFFRDELDLPFGTGFGLLPQDDPMAQLRAAFEELRLLDEQLNYENGVVPFDMGVVRPFFMDYDDDDDEGFALVFGDDEMEIDAGYVEDWSDDDDSLYDFLANARSHLMRIREVTSHDLGYFSDQDEDMDAGEVIFVADYLIDVRNG